MNALALGKWAFLVALAASCGSVWANATPASLTNAEAVKGVWVLAGNSGTAIDGASDLEILRPNLEKALAIPGVKGFSLRVTWNSLRDDLNLLEQGKRIADAHGLAFSFRVLAGYRVPPSIFADGSPTYLDEQSRGRPIPAPFNQDGSPNEVFERHYDRLLQRVTTWARANGVRLVHCPWYGLAWAELNHHLGVRGAPGYTYERWYRAHTRLFDIAIKYADESLAIELPLSGGGPTGDTVSQLADYFLQQLGPRSERFFFQANGWGPTGYWGSPDPQMEMLKRRAFDRPVLRGLQSIRQGAYDWRELFTLLRNVEATYCEIYADTLDFPGVDVMREEILRFSREVEREGAPRPSGGNGPPGPLAPAKAP
jgi:hypothetical protein